MKFKGSYIHTTTPSVAPVNEIYQPSIYFHSKTCLLSLIHSLSSGSFGWDTLERGLKEIDHFKRHYLVNDEVLYYDSGGYSIIVGDVIPRDIYKFIDCYTKALELDYNQFDYIFSLDIPVFLNHPTFNTRKDIYELNRKSLNDSINIIKNNPILKDKFCFVKQFKLKSQFQIWDYLYDELEIYKYHKNFAIGGLVGLSGMVNLQFAPFIGPLYWQLYQYHKHGDGSHPFYSHILGIYHRSYRFMLQFMIELFNAYGVKTYLTYDTINYTLSSMYKSKVGMDYYNLDNNKLKVFHSHDLSDDILSQIYKTESCLKSYHHNLERIDDGVPLTDTTFLVPLNISSQLNLDEFFKLFIADHNLVELFLSCKNYNEFKNKSNPIINSLQSYPTLTSNLITQIRESLRVIWIFNQWYQKDKTDKNKLNDLMYQFIGKINFPFDLS